MKSDDKAFNCILSSGTLPCLYFEYVNTLFGSLMSHDNVTEGNCDDAKLTSKRA